MKYPQNQFELLVKSISILQQHFSNISNIHPAQIHYLVYQQASEGQRHNSFLINDKRTVLKKYVVTDLNMEGFTPLIDFLNESNFKLYPEGCNDTHIITAVKAALKKLK